jgi:hypothetical protein
MIISLGNIDGFYDCLKSIWDYASEAKPCIEMFFASEKCRKYYHGQPLSPDRSL